MTLLCWLFLLTFWPQTLTTEAFGINLIEIPEDVEDPIACTVALLEKYFHFGENLSGSVLHMSITSAPTHLQTSLMYALHTAVNYPWTIVVKRAQSGSSNEANAKHVLHEKPQCYFLVIENLENEDVEELFESWKLSLNWNPLAQFVVYYSAVQETEDEMSDTMIEIILNFMSRKIYSVNIIGQSKESSFYIGKSVFPYHPENNCGNRAISIETLDICVNQENGKGIDEVQVEEEIEIEEGAEHDAEYPIIENEMYNYTERNDNRLEVELFPSDLKQTTSDDAEENYHFRKTLPIPNNLPVLQQTTNLLNHNLEDNFMKNNSKIHIVQLKRALFLDKFPKDLSGCPIVAGFRPWEPYIFNDVVDNNLLTLPTEIEENDETLYNLSYAEEYQGDENLYIYNRQENTNSIHWDGIEYKLIQTIAERLHINIELQLEDKNLYYLFQQLIDGEIEMVVGGIDEDPSISQFVSSTIPYHQDDLTWCVAKAEGSPNLFNFLLIFRNDAWLLTLLFIGAASRCIAVIKRYLEIYYFRSNIYVVGIIFGQSICLRPIPTSLKFCFGTLFFMGFMFSNIYQSFLISTLTTPKTSYQISHLDEIYQNRMHIRGTVENVRHLNKEGQIYRYVREQFQMCYNIEECLQQAAKDTKLAVIVSRQHFFYNPRIPRNSLYCFDRNENIYMYLVTVLMPKKFHLLHKINPVIQHVIESGHMQKWARDLDRRRKINEEMQQQAGGGQYKSLTLTQVIGSFVFINVLLAFALWMFIIESTIYWLVVKRRTRLKLAKYLHKKFYL